MARTSEGPRYYPSKKAWFANLNGERILLARGPEKETKAEAREKYDAEVAARRVEVEGDRNTVWAVLNAYLKDVENLVENEEAAENRLELHRYVLLLFNAACGAKVVRELRPQHVTDWFASMRQPRWSEKLKRNTKWGPGTVKLARGVINRAFNWAVEEAGLISANPLKRRAAGRRAKAKKRRPVETRTDITEHEHQLLIEQADRRTKKDFLYLLMFLHRTGARPAEMYGAQASEWDEGKQSFRIKADPENHGRYKLAHLGEDRWLFVPDDLVPLARELMARYPEGPIFRSQSGEPWSKGSLCGRMKSIKKAANRMAAKRGVVGVRKEVTAYSYRHAFVTRWVKENRPLPVLCELLNTSEKMIRDHYSHLFEQTQTLREALNSFDREREERPATLTVHAEQGEQRESA